MSFAIGSYVYHACIPGSPMMWITPCATDRDKVVLLWFDLTNQLSALEESKDLLDRNYTQATPAQMKEEFSQKSPTNRLAKIAKVSNGIN